MNYKWMAKSFDWCSYLW